MADVAMKLSCTKVHIHYMSIKLNFSENSHPINNKIMYKLHAEGGYTLVKPLNPGEYHNQNHRHFLCSWVQRKIAHSSNEVNPFTKEAQYL